MTSGTDPQRNARQQQFTKDKWRSPTRRQGFQFMLRSAERHASIPPITPSSAKLGPGRRAHTAAGAFYSSHAGSIGITPPTIARLAKPCVPPLPAAHCRKERMASAIALTGILATRITVPICSVRSNSFSEAIAARPLSNIAS
jgi:hypothetical protein